MRPLLEAGRVFAALPPLYSTKVGGTVHYAYTDTERDALEAHFLEDKPDRKLAWVRFKGLGEMDVDELAETTLDRSSRVLKRMTIDDAAQAASAADLFETLMGNDVSRRKDFLLRNSELVDPGTLDI
jgi:DNA gyrase subunit B